MTIEIPTECPCCKTKLSRITDQLFCTNISCPARATQKIANYCKKRKIKGLAEKSISKLNIDSIPDIYSLSEEELIYVLGKNGGKIYKQIQESLETTIVELLSSLSIPLIGLSTAKKITGNSLSNLNIAKLPPKARENLNKWLDGTEYLELQSVPFKFREMQEAVEVQDKGVMVITGSFEGHTRTTLKEIAESKGYRVASAVSKNTTVLLADKPSNTSKYNKAVELGIKIINNITEA